MCFIYNFLLFIFVSYIKIDTQSLHLIFEAGYAGAIPASN